MVLYTGRMHNPPLPTATATSDKRARRPAKELAYEWLRRAILENELPPGSFVAEADVAEAVGVSRTPVREALLRLHSERLLELVPRRGAFVAPISAAEAREVMEARAVLETWAGHLVIASDSAGVAARMLELLDQQRQLLPEAPTGTFIHLDRAFHRALVAAARNSVVVEMYDSLRDRQQRAAFTALTAHGGRGDDVIAEHHAIVSALQVGDGEMLESAIHTHLDTTLAVLLTHVPPTGRGVRRRG